MMKMEVHVLYRTQFHHLSNCSL